jgi:hypothetical protein
MFFVVCGQNLFGFWMNVIIELIERRTSLTNFGIFFAYLLYGALALRPTSAKTAFLAFE